VLSRNLAHGCGLQVWWPVDGARGGPFASRPVAEAPRPASVRPTAEAARLARAGRHDVHRVRSHRARGPRSGAAGGSSPVDGTWQGSWRTHHCSAVKVSGKRKGGGAHRGGGASVGWRGAAGAVAVEGGEAISVVADDGALDLHHRGERER
jgi:hypothetical protein